MKILNWHLEIQKLCPGISYEGTGPTGPMVLSPCSSQPESTTGYAVKELPVFLGKRAELFKNSSLHSLQKEKKKKSSFRFGSALVGSKIIMLQD